jgi:hypothetical protein
MPTEITGSRNMNWIDQADFPENLHEGTDNAI